MNTLEEKSVFKLELEINRRQFIEKTYTFKGFRSMITPKELWTDQDNFWIFRVKVSNNQAIVGFPKFSVIGIGFQKETDWNTNLPSDIEATRIFSHIKANKGDDNIPDELCIEAIQMIKNAVKEYKNNNNSNKNN